MDRITRLSLGMVFASLGSWVAGPAVAEGLSPALDGVRASVGEKLSTASPRAVEPILLAQATPEPGVYPNGQYPSGVPSPQYPGNEPVPEAPGGLGADGSSSGSGSGMPGQGGTGTGGSPTSPGSSSSAGDGSAPYSPSGDAGSANTSTPPSDASSSATDAGANAFGDSATFSPAAGGVQSGAPSAFGVMIGDQAPIFGRAVSNRPTIPGTPHQPGSRGELSPALATRAKTVIPYIRAMKYSDNQSPIPQDRIYTNFNYFNNVNYATNQRFGAPVSSMQIYRYVLGFEKTIFGGMGSIGFSESLNTLSARSSFQGLGGTSTAMGDLNLFGKFILWQRWNTDQNVPGYGGFGYPAQYPGARDGGLFSGGLSMNLPTGPGSFAGSNFSKSYRNIALQPFVAYFFTKGNFYIHGFESIVVPTDPNDVTMLFNDVGVGYYVYRNPRLDTFLTAFAPIFELHVNVPLNHTDVFNVKDPVGTPTVVDLTLGANTQFGQRTVLTLGAVAPVSGPRPFSVEAVAQLNIYFGGRQRNAPTMAGQ